MTLAQACLPTEVMLVPLGEIVDIFDSQRIPLSGEVRSTRRGPYPYYGANGLVDHIDDYLFDGEHLLLAEDGGYWGPGQSSSYVVDGKFWVNNHAHILSARDGIADNHFLSFLLNYMDLTGFISGTTRGKLTQGTLRSVEVPLPTLGEQKRIARILAAVTAYAEGGRSSVKAHEGLRFSLARALLDEARVVSNEYRFSDVVEVRSGQVDPREEPFASLPHIAPDTIESATGRLLPVRTAKELGLISGKYEFQPGDVIYSKIRPYLNKVATAPFRGTCSADMYVLRTCSTHLLQPFLFYLLLDDSFLVQAVSHQSRTGIPKINREQLNSIALHLPPLEVQERMVRACSAADLSIEAGRKGVRQVWSLFDSIIRQVLGGLVA
jgi:type I restriction enzyme S subunit